MSLEANPAPPVVANTGRYYRLDSRKVTLREYWNIVGSWKALIPWIAKLFNQRMTFSSGFPFFESVRELEIAESAFPANALQKLHPLMLQFGQTGFHSPRFYVYGSMRGETRTAFIALLHPSGATLRLMHTIALNVHPPKERITVALLSELVDGTFFCTSSQKASFLPTPGVTVNRLLGASPDVLVASHLQKLEAMGSINPARRVESLEQFDDLWNRYEKLCLDFGLKRGIYVLMTPEEVSREQQRLHNVKSMAAGVGAEHTEVLVELDKLQNKKASWVNAIIILVASLVLFLGAGSRQWSWNYVLILVPVLFVHELGHYLAMRAFNYRNLRMFFIPFFGAAVSGQHYNVAGWKKVIVSLMGPVPGIVLGTIIGGAGLILHHALLTKVAIVTLILNGFNLLPILPFDGGWVFHTLLFSRHYLLDTAFRVMATIGLAAIGILTHSKILMYVGIPMLINIPVAYRLARIATSLQQRGIPPVADGDEKIPADTAKAIIDEIKKTARTPQSNKMLAQQTLQIFETLNARPPGWLATIGLLFAHVGSLGIAVIFAVVFTVGQRSTTQDFLARFTDAQPKHTLECGTLLSWGNNQKLEATTNQGITLIANFSKPTDAMKSYEALTNRLPSTASLKVFGDSLLLSLPAEQAASRKQWLAELHQGTKNVFVENTNFPTVFSLSCRAPNADLAREIESELEGYLSTLEDVSLIPPWYPSENRSPEERAQHQLARKTYLILQRAEYPDDDGPELKELQKKLVAAMREADQAEADAIRKKINQRSETLRKKAFEEIRNGSKGPVDTNLANLFIAAHSSSDGLNETNREPILKMARCMGQLPLVNDNASPNDERFSANRGLVSRTGTTLQLNWLRFNRTIDGAPVLVEWLCNKGCTDFKYNFNAVSAGED
jgi:Zn-dependent protease